MTAKNNRIVSGMRPTGPLHLGHYFGVLINWIRIQEEHECYFFAADWHALTTEYADPRRIKGFVPELVKDWVAAGLDPEKCTIFHQSQVKEHAELHLLLSMMTPVGWLERNPTYKELCQQLSQKDIATYGFLGYPVLMATDILMYKPFAVPVGQDQLPHMELTREIARRFNNLQGEYFPEPQAMLTEEAKLPGLDGRKMSKSYHNGVYLRDTMEEVKPKIMSMLTDQNRLRKSDPGDPKVCNLFPYHKILSSEEQCAEIETGCRNASWGCVDCKKLLMNKITEFLEPIQERRRKLDENPDLVWQILDEGSKKARAKAQKNMEEIRDLIGFKY